MSIAWQPGYGVVPANVRSRNAATIRAMHGAGQQRRDRNGRIRRANGRFA